MFSNKYLGWTQAIILVFIFWGLSNIILSFVTQILDINKLVFTGTTFLSCSVCLLLYAKQGVLSRETFRSTDTWTFGFMMIANYFIALNLFSLLTPTEVTLLERLSVILSSLIGWFFFLRKPNKYQTLGILGVLVGVVMVASNIPQEIAFKVYALMLLAGLTQSLRVFIAESHKTHKKATESTGIKDRCRVIGYVMFVVSCFFWLILVVLAWLNISYPHEIGIDFEFKDFFSYTSILTGLVMGVVIYAPTRYLKFSAAEKIKAENFLAVGALSFFATWAWQALLSGLLGLETSTFLASDMIAGGIITISAFIMALGKVFDKKWQNSYENYLTYSAQDVESVEETRDIIFDTLEHFDYDKQKSAQALELSIKIINGVLQDKEHVLAFKTDILREVASKYRKNVAKADPLTGLLNKAGFHIALRKAELESNSLSMFFIDLNKFKPVNDKYGHDAGDFVLAEIGGRLKSEFYDNAYLTRYGGDEYSILLKEVTKETAEKMIDRIKELLEKDIFYKDKTINVSGSIGLASFPEDTKNPRNLIDVADEKMYTEKGDR